jgi:PIN domain nuclease of toxin-antitoxin system
VKLLLDTHVWLWAHLEPAKLASRVRAALTSRSSELWLSPISIWETLLLVEKGRITITGDPAAWVEATWARTPMHEATLNRAVAVKSRSVRVAHVDPADRFLAASAEVYDLTLVTSDEHLLRGKGYRTLANR